jgi:hypothetical protein
MGLHPTAAALLTMAVVFAPALAVYGGAFIEARLRARRRR